MSRPRLNLVIAGAIVGFLETFSIWFVPQEPYQNFIVAAGTLKGLLTALLISTSVNRQSGLGFALACTKPKAPCSGMSWLERPRPVASGWSGFRKSC